MKIYSRNEAIEAMAQTAGVSRKYHMLKCSAVLEGYTGTFVSNDEDWLLGIFDGRKYNACLLDSTFLEDMKNEYGEDVEDAISAIVEDATNPDNYEPCSTRMHRIAERVLDGWEAGNNAEGCRENIIFSANGQHIFILSDEELVQVNNNTRIYNAIWNDDAKTAKELLKEEENYEP